MARTKAPYASGTKVSEARSHHELQIILRKYGCGESGYMDQGTSTSLLFSKNGVTYRFTLEFPQDEQDVRHYDRYRPSEHGTKLEYERARKMRALVAVVKAQLVAIDEGIITFEEMFVGQAVTDNGQTVAERWAPEIAQNALAGRFPSALPLPGGPR